MRVIDIEIAHIDYDHGTSRHEGHVALTVATPNKARTVELHFISRIAQSADCPQSIVTCSLIADALRQARRMPGFRRGEEEIELVAPAPDIAARPARPVRATA